MSGGRVSGLRYCGEDAWLFESTALWAGQGRGARAAFLGSTGASADAGDAPSWRALQSR